MISPIIHSNSLNRKRIESLLRVLHISGIPIRSFYTSSVSRSKSARRGYPRVFLNWMLAGASGLAVTSSMTPHVPSRWERNVNTSSSGDKKHPSPESEPGNPSASDPRCVFPKNVKGPVFVDSKDETDDNRKEVEKRPWRGLSFLRSAPTFDEILSTLSSWSWPARFASLQEKSHALLLELSRGPGSLFSQVVNDPPDPKLYPECEWDAEVRLGDELCFGERAFLRMRKRRMRKAFAHLFGVDEQEIDERDLPIVAIAGSGGGFRAMVNTTGSLVGAEKTGILDCTAYVAGTSGSCWALGVQYSGVAGESTPQNAANHIAERIRTSYVDASVLDMLTTPPTNKYLLSGLLRKATSPAGRPSVVDLYGTLLSAQLLVPNDLRRLDPRFLSLHHFRRNVDNGSMPLPIFTAVRHEIPASLVGPLDEAKAEQKHSVNPLRSHTFKREEEEIAGRASWMWFEFTPHEVGCDEIGAWIPTWALGRRFEKGKSIDRNPELSFSILTGIFASAFCASLQQYINEVQPILRQLPAQLNAWITEIVTENRNEISVLHPVEPDEIPNFVKGLDGLRKNSPSEIAERDTLGFMDAGVELNIPYYPLFRRDVDCIIALDASADSQDLWFTRAEQYAARRGLSTWPKGARWPALIESSEPEENITTVQKVYPTATSQPRSSSETTNRAVAEAQETEASAQAQKVGERTGSEKPTKGLRKSDHHLPSEENADLTALRASRPRMSSCTIWMGSSTGTEAGQSSLLEKFEEQDLLRRDGIAIVYNPLIPNDAVPGFDPMNVSTWSFSLEKEETENLIRVSEANFVEGQEKIVKLLKAIWLRKKTERERKGRKGLEST